MKLTASGRSTSEANGAQRRDDHDCAVSARPPNWSAWRTSSTQVALFPAAYTVDTVFNARTMAAQCPKPCTGTASKQRKVAPELPLGVGRVGQDACPVRRDRAVEEGRRG